MCCVSVYLACSHTNSAVTDWLTLAVCCWCLLCCLQEGPLAFYKGWLPSVIGVVPYVGLNFGVYETLKHMLLLHYGLRDERELSVPSRLACGAAAGTMGQTVAYPFDVARRRLQVRGAAVGPYLTRALGAVFRTACNTPGETCVTSSWPQLISQIDIPSRQSLMDTVAWARLVVPAVDPVGVTVAAAAACRCRAGRGLVSCTVITALWWCTGA